MSNLSGTISFLLAVFELTNCADIALTTKEVPLYMRQSWIDVTAPFRTLCIRLSNVNPTLAYTSMMNTQVENDPNLKSYYKCISIRMNLLEETTGLFIQDEFVRQVEGCTVQVFTTCNEQVINLVDLDEKCFEMYLCIVHAVSQPKTLAG